MIKYIFFCLFFANLQCFFNTNFDIIVTSFDPYLNCINSSKITFQELLSNNTYPDFSGIFLEILKQIFKKNGIISNGEVKCINYLNISVSDSQNLETAIYLGNYQYKQIYLDKGFILSQPLLNSGLKTIILDKNKHIWSFLTPLTYETCLIIISIGLIVAIFIWFLEENKWNKSIFLHFQKLNVIIKEVFGSLFSGNLFIFHCWASRFLIWIFWFIFALFFLNYLVYLNMNMSKNYEFNDENLEFSELKKGIFLKDYEIYDQKGENFNIYSDSNKLFSDLLVKQSLDCIFLDSSLVQFYNNIYPNKLKVLPNFVITTQFILMFKGVSNDFASNFSKLLLNYQKSLEYKHTIFNFFNGNQTSYMNNNYLNYEVTVENLIGIWTIFLCALLLLSFIYFSLKLNQNIVNRLSNNVFSKYFHNYDNEYNTEIENEFEESFTNAIFRIY